MKSSRPHLVHGLPVEEQFGYWQATKADGFVYLAGQVPRGESGEAVGETPADKVHIVLEKVESLLTGLGSSLAESVLIQVNVVGDDQTLSAVSRAVRNQLGETRPAGSLVRVSGLNQPHFVVEISVIATVDEDTGESNMRQTIGAGNDYVRDCGFSDAVVRGNHIFVSGQMPIDESGGVLHPGDLVAQFRACVESLDRVLRRCDASLDDVVMTYAYLSEPLESSQFDAFCEVHRTAFSAVNRPTGTMVYVPNHPVDGVMIQFNAIAVRG